MLFIAVVSVYLSVLSFTSHLSSALFSVLLLSDPGPSLQTTRFEIYDAVSNTYPYSYPPRASQYLKLCLCSLPALAEHSLKDLVLRHCNSLSLMFLMYIPRHLGGLFIFPFSLPSRLPFPPVHLFENRQWPQVWFNKPCICIICHETLQTSLLRCNLLWGPGKLMQIQ